MTENEAKLFNNLMEHNSAYYGYELSKGEIKTVLQAFEQLKQYRVIGTVQEVAKLSNSWTSVNYKLRQFEKIGTIDEFKALKEKSVVKKQGNINDFDSHLRLSKVGFLCCSVTNKDVRYPLISLRDLDYCPRCGQKLDWQ